MTRLRKRMRPKAGAPPGGRNNSTSSRVLEEDFNESSSQQQLERIQLYRPSNHNDYSSFLVDEILFERPDLTDQDRKDFCSGRRRLLSSWSTKKSSNDNNNNNDDNDDNNKDNHIDNDKEYHHEAAMYDKFHTRRVEIRQLAQKLDTGGSEIDIDGRLVPIRPPEPPHANLQPHVPAAAQNNNNINHPGQPPPPRQPFFRGLAAAVVNENPNLPNLLNGGEDDDDDNDGEGEDQQEQRWIVEEETRDAEASIARAMERYRSQRVPDDELELILIPPPGGQNQNHHNHRLGHPRRNRNNQDNNNLVNMNGEDDDDENDGMPNLTFRRICIAALAVVTAFVAVILQTLPLLQPVESMDPNFDKLLNELLQVKLLYPHAAQCPGLHRTPTIRQNKSWMSQWHDRTRRLLGMESLKNTSLDTTNTITSTTTTTSDCDDGVLHIPSLQVLFGTHLQSTSKEEAKRFRPFALGVNVSWFLPCQPTTMSHFNETSSYRTLNSLSLREDQSPATLDNTTTCNTTEADTSTVNSFQSPFSSGLSCFRGVHDGIITEPEIEDALSMGNVLILNGGDHFDIHYDTVYLDRYVPTVLDKLVTLLETTYHVNRRHIQPVAFRVSTVGPMDGHGVSLYRAPASTLNRTRYLRWIEKCKRRNDVARYSLPWPFHVAPVRDTCNLMADMEADPQFQIHTSISLNDGAGMGYRGGVTLFVDHHPDNANPKRRIRRGVSIDGSAGRVVVSTGGVENRRCRLPTRAGLRSWLQIWWTFVDMES